MRGVKPRISGYLKEISRTNCFSLTRKAERFPMESLYNKSLSLRHPAATASFNNSIQIIDLAPTGLVAKHREGSRGGRRRRRRRRPPPS